MLPQITIITTVLGALLSSGPAPASSIRSRLCMQRVITAGPYNWGNLHEFAGGEIYDADWAAKLFKGEVLRSGSNANARRLGRLSLLLKDRGVELQHEGRLLSYFDFEGPAIESPHFKTFELHLPDGSRLVFEFRFADRRHLSLFLEEGNDELPRRKLILKAYSSIETSG